MTDGARRAMIARMPAARRAAKTKTVSKGPKRKGPAPARTATPRAGGIADAAVRAATGKGWKDWFAMLDGAGARKLDHKGIVTIVAKRADPGPWWRQMVTVAYEQERGLRKKHQKPDGFSVSRSRTVAAPAARVFAAWREPRRRVRWLPGEAPTIRRATPHRTLRITWSDGTSDVDVHLWPKGAARTQVSVQHSKLPSAAAGERMKKLWGRALEALAAAVAVGVARGR